jgi:hypothetical protein
MQPLIFLHLLHESSSSFTRFYFTRCFSGTRIRRKSRNYFMYALFSLGKLKNCQHFVNVPELSSRIFQFLNFWSESEALQNTQRCTKLCMLSVFNIIYCFWFIIKVQSKYKETCLSEMTLWHSEKFCHLQQWEKIGEISSYWRRPIPLSLRHCEQVHNFIIGIWKPMVELYEDYTINRTYSTSSSMYRFY